MYFDDPNLEPYDGDEPFIFLSYSHKDMAAAAEMIGKLKAMGYRVWYDQGLNPGAEWLNVITGKILTCSYFIALASPGYLDSRFCRNEISFAYSENKKLLIIYLKDMELPPEWKLMYSPIQALFKHAEGERIYQRIPDAPGIEVCRAEETKPTPPPAAPRKKWVLPAAIAGGAALLALLLFLLLPRSKPSPDPTASFGTEIAASGRELTASETERTAPGTETAASETSPDGTEAQQTPGGVLRGTAGLEGTRCEAIFTDDPALWRVRPDPEDPPFVEWEAPEGQPYYGFLLTVEGSLCSVALSARNSEAEAWTLLKEHTGASTVSLVLHAFVDQDGNRKPYDQLRGYRYYKLEILSAADRSEQPVQIRYLHLLDSEAFYTAWYQTGEWPANYE